MRRTQFSTSQAGAAASRLPELDGLRGCAVVLVLVWHFFGALIDTGQSELARWLYHLLILGRTGVDLFFVLSGFLITQIILRRTQANVRFLVAFYARRGLRVLPPYLLLVLLFWSVVLSHQHNVAFNSATPLWRHLTFTQNFWMSEHTEWGPGAISVTWSLAIEEHYYIFYPLLMLILRPRYIPFALTAVAVTSAAIRLFLHLAHPENAFLSYVMTLSRLDGLAVGGMIAWVYSDTGAHDWLIEHKKWLRPLLYFLLSGVPLLAIGIASDISAHMFIWGHTFLTVLYGITLVCVLELAACSNHSVLKSQALTYIGKISYSLYLFHPMVLATVFLVADRPEKFNAPVDGALAVLALMLVVAGCVFLYESVERPLQALGRRYQY